MMMKNLFERFFKKKPDFSYTIADYQPVKNRFRTDVTVKKYQIEQTAEHEEMDIDKIYQNS
jgi:hypothetical protein